MYSWALVTDGSNSKCRISLVTNPALADIFIIGYFFSPQLNIQCTPNLSVHDPK